MCDIHHPLDDEAFVLGLDSEKLNTDDYLSLISELPRSVTWLEIAGGGEPLLLKDIRRFFAAIRGKNIVGSLITNGSLLSEDLSNELVNCRWNWVRVSLNGASRETYRRVHRADHFDLVLSNVRKFQQARGWRRYPRIGMNFVVQKDNYRDIVKFVMLANELHLDSVSLDSLIVCNASRDLTLDEAMREEGVALLLEAKAKAKIPHNIDHTITLLDDARTRVARRDSLKNRWCPIVQYQLEIRSNGIVLPCCMATQIADHEMSIKKCSLAEIWNRYEKFRQDLKKGYFRSFCYDRCNYLLPVRRS
jgi:MoaA/NifB/PqqE/SkfB family radical SAM enzyme